MRLCPHVHRYFLKKECLSLLYSCTRYFRPLTVREMMEPEMFGINDAFNHVSFNSSIWVCGRTKLMSVFRQTRTDIDNTIMGNRDKKRLSTVFYQKHHYPGGAWWEQSFPRLVRCVFCNKVYNLHPLYTNCLHINSENSVYECLVSGRQKHRTNTLSWSVLDLSVTYSLSVPLGKALTSAAPSSRM